MGHVPNLRWVWLIREIDNDGIDGELNHLGETYLGEKVGRAFLASRISNQRTDCQCETIEGIPIQFKRRIHGQTQSMTENGKQKLNKTKIIPKRRFAV